MIVGDVTIEWMEIAEGERGTRRQRERCAVDSLVATLTDQPVTHAADGAPELPEGFISITHSLRIAAVAICEKHPIGIDAEEYRPALVRTKDKYLSDSEKAWASDSDLLRLWTAKEAVFKAARIPTLSLTSISVSPSFDAATILHPSSSNTSLPSFSLTYLPLGDTLLAIAQPHLLG